MPLIHNKKTKARRRSRKHQLLTTVEYRHFQLLRLVNLFAIFLFGVVLGVAIMFLYNRIYTVIGQAQHILTLDREGVGNSINFTLLDKVDAAWESKYGVDPLIVTRDPFDIVQIPEPLVTTSTTSTDSIE